MESFCDKINQGFLDIFGIFSLGMRKNSASILHHCLLTINTSLVLVILGMYVYKGKLLVSGDALSQATDVIDLFFPICIHIFVMFNNFSNQNAMNSICASMESFDESLKKLNCQYFNKVKVTTTFWYSLKFLMTHSLGMGIDSFMLITLLPGNVGWQQAIRTRVFSLNVLRLMSTQFIFYCDFLSSRMQCFNFELNKTAENSESLTTGIEITIKLQSLKKLDLKLIELSLMIRNYFKTMLWLNITADIIIVVIDIYWIYGGFVYGDNPYFLRKYKTLRKYNKSLNF